MFGNINLLKQAKIRNLSSYHWFCFQAILLGQVIFQRISKSEIMSKKPSKHIYFDLQFWLCGDSCNGVIVFMNFWICEICLLTWIPNTKSTLYLTKNIKMYHFGVLLRFTTWVVNIEIDWKDIFWKSHIFSSSNIAWKTYPILSYLFARLGAKTED